MSKWKKGQSGNPKGRPPILLPEIQREVDRNRGALKSLILQYLNLTEAQIMERQLDPNIPFLEKMLGQCLERTANDGDVLKLRALLEIVFGRLPEEKEPFELSPEERLMVLTYRKRIEEKDGERAIPDSPKND